MRRNPSNLVHLPGTAIGHVREYVGLRRGCRIVVPLNVRGAVAFDQVKPSYLIHRRRVDRLQFSVIPNELQVDP